jgi:hypothetical protein
MPSTANRFRQSATRSADMSTREAISRLVRPSAANSTNFARTTTL